LPKKEIFAYLQGAALPFCVDESNNTDLFLRNRIRRKLIPSFESVDARARQKLTETMLFLQSESVLLESLVAEKFQVLALERGEVTFLNLNDFLGLSEMLQKKLLQLLLCRAGCQVSESQALFAEILRFVKNKKSATHQICDFTITKQQNKLFVVQTGSPTISV
jgi:tRNA(Ile)-lysidine synthase